MKPVLRRKGGSHSPESCSPSIRLHQVSARRRENIADLRANEEVIGACAGTSSKPHELPGILLPRRAEVLRCWGWYTRYCGLRTLAKIYCS